MKNRRIDAVKIGCVTGLLVAILLMTSCGEMKFETLGWTSGMDAGVPSPRREKMLNDLLTNYDLVGMPYRKVVNLLGTPDDIDGSVIRYNVVIDYGYDIDPVYTKRLDLFYRDSVVYRVEVIEVPSRN